MINTNTNIPNFGSRCNQFAHVSQTVNKSQSKSLEKFNVTNFFTDAIFLNNEIIRTFRHQTKGNYIKNTSKSQQDVTEMLMVLLYNKYVFVDHKRSNKTLKPV